MKLKPGMREKENGSIEYRFVIDGKRYSVTAKSMKDLSRKEQELRTKIASGQLRKEGNITLDDYYKEWIERKRLDVRPSTIRNYGTVYKKWIKPSLGQIRMKDIVKKDVQDLHNHVKAEKSSTLANDVLIVVKMIFTSAIDSEILHSSPADGIKRFSETSKKASETIHRALTVEEQKKLMEALKGEWLFELYALMLNTGMRSGEAAALTWDNVDYKNNVIHIRQTMVTDDKGRPIVGPPKTSTSVRDIPMNKSIRSILAMQKEKLASIRKPTDTGFLFYSLQKKIFRPNHINYPLQRTAERIGLEKIGSHALRDTFATRFIEQGGNMQTLKVILGHSSIQMTMDLYAHVLPNTKQAEMDMLDIGF